MSGQYCEEKTNEIQKEFSPCETWENIKPQIDELVNKIDCTLSLCGDIDRAEERAYNRGLKDAEEKAHWQYCKNCPADEFYSKSVLDREVLQRYIDLPSSQKEIICKMIFALSDNDLDK